MPIDPSIYNMVGKYPQIQIPDPIEKQTKLAQLRQFAAQGEESQLRLGEMKSKQASQLKAKELLAKHRGDLNAAHREASETGLYDVAEMFQGTMKQQAQTNAILEKSIYEAKEASSKMTEAERKQAQAALEDLAKGINWVEHGAPEERESRYAIFAQTYPPEVRQKYNMGPQYDPAIGGLIKARATAWDKVSGGSGAASAVGKIMQDWKQGLYGPGKEGEALRDAAIKDATTKAPAVQVGLGGVESGVDAEGNPVFFQPRKAGGAAEVIPNVKPAPKATDTKKKEDPGTAAAILDEAENLVKKAPGSFVGAGKALVQRGIGISTESSQAQAQLNALQASLMMRMPRMEGPQSDKDVALYREQAGRIADPTIPYGDKLAAIKTIRNIVTKYAAKPSAQPKPDKPAAGGKVSLSEIQQAIKPGGKYAGKTVEQVKSALKSRGIEVE